jgi:hypothetical protein
MGGIILVGWLSRLWAQTASVANWGYATFVRHLGEAAETGGKRSAGRAPSFHHINFALQLRKIMENLWKTGMRSANQPKGIRLVDLAITRNGLEGPSGSCRPSFRVRRRGQPSVSVSIWWVAVLVVSPRQLTLSQSSQAGLWCGRQTEEHRVSSWYLHNREHQ